MGRYRKMNNTVTTLREQKKKRASRMSHKLYGSKLRFSSTKISMADEICQDFCKNDEANKEILEFI